MGKRPPVTPSEEPEKQVFWALAPLKVKLWADVDDEDDDDYYTTMAPPQSVWGLSGAQHVEEKPGPEEEIGSGEDILDEGGDDVEEEHDRNQMLQYIPESVVKKAAEVSYAPKEAERRLFWEYLFIYF
ncbi:uncharacterized protein LOC132284595 [Cornus florida]|uniref:uncharacterized protein LOC132284595 n=1 Tax=Cornus florida TaxID=4283 RepID=UPI00289FCF50|nr:uncharacterized protein LOC132284595 [Cornus florida]